MKSLWTTFRYSYTNLRWQIIGWGIGLALYGLMIVPMYESLGAQPEKFQQMIAGYPPEFLAFFGADVNSPITPQGFLSMYAFSMLPVIIGVFSVIAGSGLIVGDEEHGRLDLIIAHPVGRTPFFWGRFLGLLSAELSIVILGWLGFSILLGRSSLGVTWYQMAVPFLTLLVQLLVFSTFALVLSMLLPSRNLSAMVSGAFMVISYMVSSLSFLDQSMDMLSKLLPYHYYQSVLSIQQLDSTWFFALIGVSLAMTALAYARFSRRDIRLSGEGSWRKK
jgi:beta-exotoxin I transport system permease protein